MSKQLRLDVAQLTDVGRKRPHNEDNMAYVIPKDPQVMARKGALFIVADGMGGHAAGEVASEIAVDTVSYSYYQDDGEDVAASLLQAIRRANSLIHQRAAENMLRSGMGTTCVAAVLRGNVAYIANVGDSRAYLIRRGQTKQVSQDHSWVAEQVRAGLLTEDQARSHAQRNVITRCLGTQSEVDVDVFTEQLEEGDSFILCTDGLSGLVGDEELRTIVDQYVPQESVYHLVERANENGGPDNITAIVIRIQEAGWEPPVARYPVHVGGGRETGEDTALLGRLPSTPLIAPMHADGFRSPGTGIRVPTGSLVSPDTATAPQPALKAPKVRRSRLLYPTMVLCVFLVVALIASGSYLFIRARGGIVDADATMTTAGELITQAQKDVNSNPASALQGLAQARTRLFSIPQEALNGAQSTRLNTLRSTLTSTVQQAITAYNRQYKIASLPCANTPTTGINSGSSALQASNVAVVQDNAGKEQSYILASDNHLYTLNGQQLGNKVPVANTDATVQAIASDGVRLIALISVPGKGSELSLVLPQNNSLPVPIVTPQGYTPKFIALANNDVSVILIPDAASTQLQIVNYTIAGNGANEHFERPITKTISVSKSVVSVAALNAAQKTQLLFLLSDGSIQSLPLINGTSTSPGPGSVQVFPSIASPLALSATDFTNAQEPVPTPVSLVTQSLTPLSVSGATLLVAGPKDLYVVATGVNGVNSRILDLQAVSGAPNTPTKSATSQAVGGGVASTDTTLHMTLVQQYASSILSAKGLAVAANPKGNGFYLLMPTGQSPSTSQLVPVQKVCIP
ncbi:MAG: Stp1/IreP family PP2C-type Ser/Thr phosphatase, partial [Ktedonobacteraceae bacterium]|nr:Stp1/IreP family PP2C-type Ser/Thr phosphatase [Ktedonobacteraceae bacterium]